MHSEASEIASFKSRLAALDAQRGIQALLTGYSCRLNVTRRHYAKRVSAEKGTNAIIPPEKTEILKEEG